MIAHAGVATPYDFPKLHNLDKETVSLKHILKDFLILVSLREILDTQS